ncbi:MAG: oligosaccharide flippase family protein [bacterium]
MTKLDDINQQDARTEKRSESSGRRTAKKATVIIVSRAVSKLVAAVSAVILARVLAKEEFGLLQFILTAYLTVSMMSQLGLPESVFYFFERVGPESRKTYALLMARVLFLLGAAGSLILIGLTFIAPMWGFEVGWLFLPLVLLCLMDLPCSLTPNVLVAIDRTTQAAWFNLINSSVLFGATVVPALLGQPLSVIVLCLVGYGILRFLVSSGFFLRNFRTAGGELPSGIVGSAFSYAVPLAVANILWTLNRYVDKYIVAAFLPVAVYAEYSIGAQEIPFVPTIAYSVAMVMMPQLVASYVQGDRTTLLSLWFQAIRKVSLLILPVMVLFIVVADEFIVVAFTEKYANAALPFRIYTLILFQRVTSYSAVLKAVGQTRAVTNHAIYVVLLNVVLSIPLCMVMGVAGPPIATVVASFVTWFYLLVKIKQALEVEFRHVFPFGSYLKTLLVACVAALPALFLDRWLHAGPAVALAAKSTTYVASYLTVALATGVCQKTDLKFLASLVGVKVR